MNPDGSCTYSTGLINIDNQEFDVPDMNHGAESTIYYGDVDMDGRITEKDATMILEYVVKEITLTDEQKARADVDGDGYIAGSDVSLILMYLAGNIDSFPAGK